MLTPEQIKGLNIEPSSRCNARCPFCSRLQKIRPYGGHIITLADFKRLPASMLGRLKWLNYGGNFGDLGTNPDLPAIAAHVRALNTDVVMGGDTNGSVQSEDWWAALGRAYGRGSMGFCIDGLADTHARHRVGTDFRTVLRNAAAFIAAGGAAYWKFIVFKHNQHQIEAACRLARECGFKGFSAIVSRDYDDRLETPDTFAVTVKRELFEALGADKPIARCKPFHKGSIYIAADGTVHPCCQAHTMFITEHNQRFRFIVPLVAKHLEEINFKTRPLADILQGPYFRSVFEQAGPCEYCRLKCGGALQAVRRELVVHQESFGPSD
ncbi:MAG: SPASM domain-containing protein [Desulfobacterales bacterium]|nr:SPASM domain-containing protein [Desulfobacterales bacterium]MDJ0885646.1 SPASM domain-containing protein [Desulfobacterales bacterium]